MVADKKSTAHGVKAKRTAAAKKSAAKQHAKPETEAVVTVDRRESRASRDRRSMPDRRVHQIPVAVERRVCERRVKVNRRRQIDPTTCERDYTPRRNRVHERDGRLQAPQRADVPHVQRSAGSRQVARLCERKPDKVERPADGRSAGGDDRDSDGCWLVARYPCRDRLGWQCLPPQLVSCRRSSGARWTRRLNG